MSGVRSSCDASPTNRRSRASDAVRSANAASIWPIIALSASPSRPTSVCSSAGSTRRDRSPAAIAPAVSPICSSGRSPSLHDPPREEREREQHADRDEQLDEQEVVQRVVDVAQRDRDDERSRHVRAGRDTEQSPARSARGSAVARRVKSRPAVIGPAGSFGTALIAERRGLVRGSSPSSDRGTRAYVPGGSAAGEPRACSDRTRRRTAPAFCDADASCWSTRFDEEAADLVVRDDRRRRRARSR